MKKYIKLFEDYQEDIYANTNQEDRGDNGVFAEFTRSVEENRDSALAIAVIENSTVDDFISDFGNYLYQTEKKNSIFIPEWYIKTQDIEVISRLLDRETALEYIILPDLTDPKKEPYDEKNLEVLNNIILDYAGVRTTFVLPTTDINAVSNLPVLKDGRTVYTPLILPVIF